jgi:WD40 repeat protein
VGITAILKHQKTGVGAADTVSSLTVLFVAFLQTGAPSVCLPAKQGSRTKCTHVSADGSTAVLLLFDSSIAIYDARSGQLKCQLMQRGDRDSQRVHSGGVNAVYLTADGGRAVSVSKDATARVWDTTSGQCTLVLQVCVCAPLSCNMFSSILHRKHFSTVQLCFLR